MAPWISTDMAIPCARARPTRAQGGFVYRVARRLEAYSFAAAPEQLAIEEGLRAAVVVASLVALAVWLDRPMLSWAAFGAFWTCLADPGGSDRRRLACMGGFALAGSIAALAGAAAGALGVIPGGVVLLVLAFLTGLSGTYGPAAAQVGTLAAVVAVVAVAFPQPPQGALALSLNFLLGTIWALVLCIGIWRIHPYATARRALGAVYLQLGDMLSTLLALDRQGDADWTAAEAEHRRAVRSAIERARGVTLDLASGPARYRGELDTVDRIFAALIAAGHDRAMRSTALTAAERDLLHRLVLLLAEMRHETAQRTPEPGLLAAEAAALGRAAAAVETVTGRAAAMAAATLAEQARAWAQGPAEATAAREDAQPTAGILRPVPGRILHHAARLAVAVVVAYAIAAALGLSFSYWATMATVVVVQPVAGATWPRSLERMLGSIAGGLIAALLVLVAPTPLILLAVVFPIAATAIALRRVNYALFVVAVTCLFVLVAELLLPATGIPVARAINSVIGSVVGAAAGLLWPERGDSGPAAQLANAVAANFALAAEAVEAGVAATAFNAARRGAGVASTAAETTCHRLALAGQSRRLHLREAASLLAALRRLAGAAMAQALAGATPDPARAATIGEDAALLVAALRHPAASAVLPIAAPQPDDEIRAALASVTEAVAAYVALFQPRIHCPA